MKTGRNDPCHCGSGKKYKHCHYAQDSVKHETPEPEVAVTEDTAPEDGAADGAEDGQAQGSTKIPPSHQKDRSRFEGQARGRSHSFKSSSSRSSQRGS